MLLDDVVSVVSSCSLAVKYASNGSTANPTSARTFLPAELDGAIELAASLEATLDGADAVVIATEWPAFAALDPTTAAAMRRPVVLDPNGFLAQRFATAVGVTYLRVGMPR